MNGKDAIWYAQAIDNTGLRRGRSEAQSIWKQMGDDASDVGMRIQKIWGTVGTVIGAASFTEFAKSMVRVRGEFQQLEIAFSTMLKSGDKARKLMSDLSEFAATTPFGLQSSASGAKQLIAYGSVADTVIDELRMLGDVAAGTGQSINDLVYLYGTLRTQGRAFTMDIRQFAGRGIPIYDELAKVLGIAKEQVSELVSAGNVGFAEVEQAFKNMTAAGGMYGGLMEAQSKSVIGRIEQLKDAIDIMFNEIGKSSEGAIYSAISGAASLIENYEKVGKILVGLIATYGAYRTAIIANNVVLGIQQHLLLQTALSGQALTKWQALQAVMTTRLTVVTNMLNKTMLANPYVLAATAVFGLVAAMWALHDSTTAAEKAQNNYNSDKNEAIKKEKEHENAIDSLISKINEVTTAELDRIGALDELKALYPDIIDKYVTEEGHLTNIAALKREIADIESENKVQATEVDLNEWIKIRDAIKKYQIDQRRFDTELLDKGKLNELGANRVDLMNNPSGNKTLEYINKQIDLIGGDLSGMQVLKWKANLKNLTDEQIKVAIDERKRLLSTLEKETDKANMEDGALSGLFSKNQIQEQLNVLSKLSNSVSSNYANDLAIAKSAWEDAKKQLEAIEKDKANFQTKQYQDAKTEEEARKKAYQDLGGDISTNAKTVNDAKQEAGQRAKELANLQRGLADEESQARIDRMDDGLEKILAQNEKNHRRELRQIMEQREEILAAYKQTDKSITELPVSDRMMFDSLTATADLNKSRADEKAMQDEKERLSDALKDFQTYQERYTAIEKKYNKIREDIEVSGGNKGNIDEADIQEKEEFSRLDNEFASRESTFRAWMNQIAKMTLDELYATLNEAKHALSSAEASGVGGSELAAARAKVNEAQHAIDKQREQAESESPDKDAYKEWQDLYKILQKVEGEFEDIGDTVGGTAGEIIKTAGRISGSALKMISSITQLAKLSVTSTKMAAEGASKAIIAVEKASVILAVIQAAIAIIHTLTNQFKDNEQAIREAENAVYEYERAINKIQIDSQYDLFDTIFGEDALGKFKKAIDVARQSLTDIQNQIEDINSLNPTNFLTNFLDSLPEKYDYEDVFNAMDMADGIEAVFDDRNWWNKLWGTGDDKIKIHAFDINEYINTDGTLKLKDMQAWFDKFNAGLDEEEKRTIQNMLDSGAAYNEAITAQKDYMKSIFGDLANNIADNMVDAFLETGDAAENLGQVIDDVAKNMAKSIISNLIFDKVLNGLQDDVLALMQNGDMAGAARLVKNAVDGISTMVPEFVKELESLGLVAGEADDKVRTASSKGLAAASQDSVNKLDGILTSISGNAYRIYEMMCKNQQIQQANTNTVLGHLSAIRDNTGHLIHMREHLRIMQGQLEDVSVAIKTFKTI